jgi:hypothetical protein
LEGPGYALGVRWTLPLLVLLVWVPGAAAQEAEAVLGAHEAALFAAETHSTHCADAEAADHEVAGIALEKVAPAWRRVSASYRTHSAPYLLYWRALLAQCLSREDEAIGDLAAFVAALNEAPGYAEQLRDARRRLRQLGQPLPREVQPPPSWTPGLAVAVGGIGVGLTGAAVHGGSWSAAEYEAETNTHGVDSDEYARLQGVNRAGFGLILAGGAAAVVGGIVAGALGRPDGAEVGVGAAPLGREGVVIAVTVVR